MDLERPEFIAQSLSLVRVMETRTIKNTNLSYHTQYKNILYILRLELNCIEQTKVHNHRIDAFYNYVL